MGWCSGTAIFDGVLDGVLEYLPEDKVETVVESVANILWEGDWDCEMDSKYYWLPEPVMKRKYPHYFDYDDDEDESFYLG